MWGHEHRVVVLEDPTVVQDVGSVGRIPLKNAFCIGHGAMPQEKDKDNYGPTNPENPNHNYDNTYTPGILSCLFIANRLIF
jgi:hypothetical protein